MTVVDLVLGRRPWVWWEMRGACLADATVLVDRDTVGGAYCTFRTTGYPVRHLREVVATLLCNALFCIVS